MNSLYYSNPIPETCVKMTNGIPQIFCYVWVFWSNSKSADNNSEIGRENRKATQLGKCFWGTSCFVNLDVWSICVHNKQVMYTNR